MKKKSNDAIPLIYRPYNLPVNFPVVAFLGDNWIVSMKKPQFLHFHNCVEIGYCITGSGYIHLNGNTIPYEKGDISIIYANIPHISINNQGPSKWEYIYFDPELLLNNGDRSCCLLLQELSTYILCPSIIKSELHPLLYHLLSNIFTEFHTKRPLYQDYVNGSLLAALSMIGQIPRLNIEYLCDQHLYSTIHDALLFIHKHFKEAITIQDLSSLCCLSESHLRRVFKMVTGFSPLEFIQHYRIQQACHLIYLNQEPLSIIAKQVGFPSISSFNRQFQQCMQMSPSEWKKTCLFILDQHEVTSFHDSNTRHIFQV
jgi:AraC-like DNA-binding protein